MDSVSKSEFKARALEYFRKVQRTGKPLIVTDRGRPVVKVVPFDEDPLSRLEELRGTVTRYVDPTEPLTPDDWEALK